MTRTPSNDQVTIHTAVKKGDLLAVKQMILDGASVNELDSLSFTPLHWAANVGAVEVLQFLLWKNADPMIVTTHGWTAIHIAAIRGFESCIQSLADRSVCLSTQDKRGQSPGHLAAIHGNSSSLSTLLRAGADIESIDSHGWSMLHAAAFHGRLGCTQILLRWGLRVEDTDKAGNTPVHLAAMEGHLPVLQCLVSQVKSPIYLFDNPNDNGETPEALATRFLKYDIVNYIEKIKNGQLFNSNLNEFEQSAFPAHIAAYSGDIVHLRVLIETGVVKINERDEQGSTPLHKAAGQGHVKIVQWLRENGADPNLRNHLGETPADIAKRYGQLGIVDLLKCKCNDENETLSDIDINISSDIPYGYVEGEIMPQLILDKNAALGRAQKRIEKFQRYLELAKSDYKQLGGEDLTIEEKNYQEHLQKIDREQEKTVEELTATLEYERLKREKLEAKLDESRREIARLNLRLTDVSMSQSENENLSNSGINSKTRISKIKSNNRKQNCDTNMKMRKSGKHLN